MAKEIVKYEKKSYLKNYMFDGIILAALGLIMLVWPNEALKVLCCVSGGLLAVMGFIRLALFLMSSKEDRTVSALIIAILQLAVGIVLIIASDFFVKLFFIVTGLLLAYGAILMFVDVLFFYVFRDSLSDICSDHPDKPRAVCELYDPYPRGGAGH